MLNSRKLRHRVIIEYFDPAQDQNTGAMEGPYVELATVWASIEALSARELIAAQAVASKVSGKIIIRYRNDIKPSQRIYHAAKDAYYNIEGILPDKVSGMEYLTVLVSEGVQYQSGLIGQVPIILTDPVITGTPESGEILSLSNGIWANDPSTFQYQWYKNDVSIVGATEPDYVVSASPGDVIKGSVKTNNRFGPSAESFSDGVPIV